MKIGTMMGATGSTTIEDLVLMAKETEAAGLDQVWLANIFSFDAISVLTIVGREVPRIRLGTAVTPTYPRHPTAIAQQALTAAAATENRFTLGIGLSHKLVIEDMLGLSYQKPAKHMTEYLKVLMPLARREPVTFKGEEFVVNGWNLDIPGAKAMPVVVAALGPRMLKVAGELADGTNTWMVGPKTMKNHIVPGLGNQNATVVGGVPMILTKKIDEAREQIAKDLVMYGQLPSYRAMLDREGVTGPADIACVGDENYLRGQIRRYEDAGVTDLNIAIMDVEQGGYARTLEFLSSIKSA
ncbi:MAG: LLM class F420-dependent oxidoreductase [Gammaproteobacteria bacterium]|nr:LLM class F420-dependent oxidoreductase [Gammaproteobacteria bacterium]